MKIRSQIKIKKSEEGNTSETRVIRCEVEARIVHTVGKSKQGEAPLKEYVSCKS